VHQISGTKIAATDTKCFHDGRLTGWTDWGEFSRSWGFITLGSCLKVAKVSQIFKCLKIAKVARFWATLFHETVVHLGTHFDRKWVWLHSGRFFLQLVWSPCRLITLTRHNLEVSTCRQNMDLSAGMSEGQGDQMSFLEHDLKYSPGHSCQNWHITKL
jgi:hypothetical protein